MKRRWSYPIWLDHVNPGGQRLLLVVLGLAAITTLLATAFLPLLPPQIPILYSLARPEDALMPKIWILFFPAISLVNTSLLLGLLYRWRSRDGLLESLLIGAATMLSSVYLLALIRILTVIN